MSRAETLAGLAEAIAGQVVAYVGECICHEGYTGRNLVDPSCCWHMLGDDFASETAAVALAWLEGQMTEERTMRMEAFDTPHGRGTGSVWYARRVTAWAPVETGEDA